MIVASLDQGKQVLSLFSKATGPQVQQLIHNGDIVKMLLVAPDLRGVDRGKLQGLLRVWINRYENEKTRLAWFYPKRWKVPSVKTQARNLAKAFPSFVPTYHPDAQKIVVPKGADGIAILPTLISLGRLWDIKEPHQAGYGRILEQHVLGAIAQSRPFQNYRAGELTESYIRVNAEVLELLIPLEEEAERQGFNCLALPVNLGNWQTRDTYSPRNARGQALHLPPSRLPLGSVQNGCLLLAMPDRLTAYEQLWMWCAGDEYSWEADGYWSFCPYFRFDGAQLRFNADGADFVYDYYGSPVAFGV
jgi:hypothetical protein